MIHGYGMKDPYVVESTNSEDSLSLTFVSNGDGTGELYLSGPSGPPDMSALMGGIRLKDGRFVAYDMDGNEESYPTHGEAWAALSEGFDREGVVMYQAIKEMPSSEPGIRDAVSIRHVGDHWVVRRYATIDDGYNRIVRPFSIAYRRETEVVSELPDYSVRVIRPADNGDDSSVVLAI